MRMGRSRYLPHFLCSTPHVIYSFQLVVRALHRSTQRLFAPAFHLRLYLSWLGARLIDMCV